MGARLRGSVRRAAGRRHPACAMAGRLTGAGRLSVAELRQPCDRGVLPASHLAAIRSAGSWSPDVTGPFNRYASESGNRRNAVTENKTRYEHGATKYPPKKFADASDHFPRRRPVTRSLPAAWA
ncbi:hypothetical protein BQ8794_60295 [Mesorhizobium prunaredense]|uniref:Uncharacterized protein n=1 Tax=Mesorhizobium prunaredense TaxID=1631249 RepID=A0A1R3VJD4_9HYPH|nr:hypothetical protein BQ8794_60295 [Mesorhizobium prunaredense]